MRTFIFKLFLLVFLFVLFGVNTFAQVEFVKHPGNPLAIHGSPSWNQVVYVPYVIYNPDSSMYQMWFTEWHSYPNQGIGYAKSYNGINWDIHPVPVMIPGPNGWDSLFAGAVCVVYESGAYKMWYTGWKSSTGYPHSIGYATSPDGINWTKHGSPVITPGTGWESGAVSYPSVIKETGGYRMFYTGEVSNGIARTGRAFSTDGITWQKDLVNNPVLLPGGAGAWDQNNFLARVMKMNDSLYMWYTGENNPGVSGMAIGFATSGDSGKTWMKYPGNPVLSRGIGGSWDANWIETGSVVYKDGLFNLYYDGGGSGINARVGLATAPFTTPVELTAFTAISNYDCVILNWTTATEINNRGFSIERKSANSDYSEIGFVPGFGTTVEPKSYSFKDSKFTISKYTYRLKQIDFDGSYEYSPEVEVEVSMLLRFSLEQNYPNPFNPSTIIGYGITEKSNVKITILNLIGEETVVLLSEEKEPGYHIVEFNAADFPSGIYFYQLKAGNFISTKKMMILK